MLKENTMSKVKKIIDSIDMINEKIKIESKIVNDKIIEYRNNLSKEIDLSYNEINSLNLELNKYLDDNSYFLDNNNDVFYFNYEQLNNEIDLEFDGLFCPSILKEITEDVKTCSDGDFLYLAPFIQREDGKEVFIFYNSPICNITNIRTRSNNYVKILKLNDIYI